MMQSKFAKGMFVFLITGMLFVAMATALAPSAHAASTVKAVSPDCGTRSAEGSFVVDYSFHLAQGLTEKVTIHLSECETQDLIEKANNGNLGANVCTAVATIASVVAKKSPNPNKINAICTSIGASLAVSAARLQAVDAKGCGIDLNWVTIAGSPDALVNELALVSKSFSMIAQACPPGVAPKGNGKDLGTRYLPAPASVVLMSAVADSFTIDECNIPHVLTVLANDDVARNGVLPDVTITDVSGATLGTASAGPRYIAYTPSGDPETGTDTLSYTVTDNVTGDTVVGTATVTLTECNGDD